ncbi:auxin-responsive protein SAUR50 [Punica granatum]|uniref:Uncharacterized protein n=2 Tax=Punica granatum TaxID=22663 RepID=A0A218W4C0_PUNGR|nr:auxin-responsive protein SAUR50 [Punica granatum]OWM67466.1 hypothetical protein CDL15_Pgr028329 [Punica granatum]PKI32214.1 hypothetical protein CRG98_047385 [Punica granatum]
MPVKVECDWEGMYKRAPKGHFVVYVGRDHELTRFVLPLSCLKNPIVHQLLDNAAEEYDNFDKQDRIVLPCDVATFERLTAFLARHP